jgi:hypothetical protein
MALAIVWRNPSPLIRTERTLPRNISSWFDAVYAATDPDPMTENDAIAAAVEYGLGPDMTGLEP